MVGKVKLMVAAHEFERSRKTAKLIKNMILMISRYVHQQHWRVIAGPARPTSLSSTSLARTRSGADYSDTLGCISAYDPPSILGSDWQGIAIPCQSDPSIRKD